MSISFSPAPEDNQQTIEVKFQFGNYNSFHMQTNMKTTLTELLGNFCKITKIPEKNIRYAVSNGILFGTGITDFNTSISNLDMLNNRIIVHIVLSNDDNYPLDKIIQNKYIRSKKPQRTTTWNDIIGDTYSQNLRLEDVPITLSNEQFDALTETLEIEINTDSTEEDSDFNCFCGNTEGEIIRKRSWLPCGHSFHTKCIKHHLTIINVKCPLCCTDVRDEST